MSDGKRFTEDDLKHAEIIGSIRAQITALKDEGDEHRRQIELIFSRLNEIEKHMWIGIGLLIAVQIISPVLFNLFFR